MTNDEIAKVKYCIDCKNPFPIEELSSCICDDYFGENSFKIVTRYGVKESLQLFFHCKECKRLHHEHKGEAFV